jgi:glycerate kinase
MPCNWSKVDFGMDIITSPSAGIAGGMAAASVIIASVGIGVFGFFIF